MAHRKLIGPFKQLLTLNHLAVKGAISDSDLEVVENAAIVVEDGLITEVGPFEALVKTAKTSLFSIEEQPANLVALPGFVDPHTHICWAGNRANDYALRLNGKTYLDIAAAGGGIWSTVTQTREAMLPELTQLILQRANRLLRDGITTIEVKSGYGLNTDSELKMLQAISNAIGQTQADLIPTCLAAHIFPKDFNGTSEQYLNYILSDLLPKVKQKGLAKRVDIYTDQSAFQPEESLTYLKAAHQLGFDITIHADQFRVGGSAIACEIGALSADHLEFSGDKEIELLAKSSVIPVALPASSLGLGVKFAPVRKLLDKGASLAIGSDWNPGSAPMGDLLLSAAILGMYEKLNTAETFAAITFRAAKALGLSDRGILKPGFKADFIAFELNDYKEILYNQGRIKPALIWKNGILVS